MVANGREKYNGVSVLVPSELDFPRLFTPDTLQHVDAARWIVGTIIRKAAHGYDDDKGYVSLSAVSLRDTVGRRDYPKVRDALAPVIETRSHIAGVRCRGYRLSGGVSGGVEWVQLRQPGIVSRVLAWRDEYRKQQDARLSPIHRTLRRHQRDYLTVADEIDAAVDSLSGWAQVVQSAAVQRVRDGEPAFVLGRTGRVYTTFAGLKKMLRPHTRLAGDTMKGLDLAASQPSLLAALPQIVKADKLGSLGVTTYECMPPRVPCSFASSLASWASSPPEWVVSAIGELGTDFDEYRDVVQSGDIYLALADMASHDGLRITLTPKYETPRDWAKKRFLVDVLNASKARYLTPFARMVHRRWPSVVGLALRSGGELIGTLQRVESLLVVETVCPRLVRRMPVLSLHDAVFVREQDAALARGVFDDVIAELRLPLRLKGELCSVCEN